MKRALADACGAAVAKAVQDSELGYTVTGRQVLASALAAFAEVLDVRDPDGPTECGAVWELCAHLRRSQGVA